MPRGFIPEKINKSEGNIQKSPTITEKKITPNNQEKNKKITPTKVPKKAIKEDKGITEVIAGKAGKVNIPDNKPEKKTPEYKLTKKEPLKKEVKIESEEEGISDREKFLLMNISNYLAELNNPTNTSFESIIVKKMIKIYGITITDEEKGIYNEAEKLFSDITINNSFIKPETTLGNYLSKDDKVQWIEFSTEKRKTYPTSYLKDLKSTENIKKVKNNSDYTTQDEEVIIITDNEDNIISYSYTNNTKISTIKKHLEEIMKEYRLGTNGPPKIEISERKGKINVIQLMKAYIILNEAGRKSDEA